MYWRAWINNTGGTNPDGKKTDDLPRAFLRGASLAYWFGMDAVCYAGSENVRSNTGPDSAMMIMIIPFFLRATYLKTLQGRLS